MQRRAGKDSGITENDGVLSVETMEDWEQLLSRQNNILVMFTSKYCGVCSRMKRSYISLRERVRRDTPLIIIDIDKSDRQLCIQALGEVAFVPTFQIYTKGERVAYFMANGDEDLRTQVFDAGLERRFNPPKLSCWDGLLRGFKTA